MRCRPESRGSERLRLSVFGFNQVKIKFAMISSQNKDKGLVK